MSAAGTGEPVVRRLPAVTGRLAVDPGRLAAPVSARLKPVDPSIP
ncbi:MAG TPA: hypothetical protein VES42_12575 [Pilimelia sp.]|nr:hypothetical protein [Pilimelia sp.]